MDLTALAERYASMQTEELVDLHQAGTLLADSYPVLESELARRGVSVGPRPEDVTFVEEPSFFLGHWSGLHSANSANVFVARLVPALMAITFSLTYGAARYVAPGSGLPEALPALFAALLLAYLVFAAVSVWRCARNETSTVAIIAARYRGLLLIAILAVAALVILIEAIP